MSELQGLIKTGVEVRPPVIIIYGEGGRGKTSFGAKALNPIFLQTEKGQGTLDFPRMDVNGFDDFKKVTSLLSKEKHDYKTLVIDSLDWLEPMVWDDTIRNVPTDKGVFVKSIQEYPYNKGFCHTIKSWDYVFKAIDHFNKKRDMMVVLIAHAKVKTHNPPDSAAAYDKYSIKLFEPPNDDESKGHNVAKRFHQYADCVFFTRLQAATSQDAINKKKHKGSVYLPLELLTVETPFALCKNRFDMPPTMPFDKETAAWPEIAKYIPWLKERIETTPVEQEPEQETQGETENG